MIKYRVPKDSQLYNISADSLGMETFIFKAYREVIVILTWHSCMLAASSLWLCVRATDFVRWRLGFRGSLTVHARAFHAIFTFPFTLTFSPLPLFTPLLIVRFFLLSFWNANIYEQLFLHCWHISLFSSICGELWYILHALQNAQERYCRDGDVSHTTMYTVTSVYWSPITLKCLPNALLIKTYSQTHKLLQPM